MNALYCCCNPSGNKRREDVYYMRDEEKVGSYSWDKDRLDPADFEFADRCGEILLKTHNHINGQQFVIDNCKSYKTVSKIDLLNSLGKVKLDYESSFFPVISLLKDGDQIALVICIQNEGESDVNFTKKTLKLTGLIQHKHIRIFSLKQYHNKKNVTLPSILEALMDSVSFVVIEVNDDHKQLESVVGENDYCILLSGGAIRLTKKYLHNLEP